MQSQNHWKALWNKFQGKIPPPEYALGLNRQWVQSFSHTRGKYLFNHLTGEHGWAEGHVEPAHAEALPIVHTEPPRIPAQRGPDQNDGAQEPVVADPWAEAERRHTMQGMAAPPLVPAAPQAMAPQAPQAVAPARLSEQHAPDAPAHNPDGFAEAMQRKETWRSFATDPSKLLEDRLYQATKSWDFDCIVCKAKMGRGVADHIPSQNHWKNLWQKFNNGKFPPPEHARGLDKQWAQQFQTPQGFYAFNHLTGEQGWSVADGAQAEVPQTVPSHVAPIAANQVHRDSQPMYASKTSTSPSYPAAALPAALVQVNLPITSSGAGFDLAHWLWMQHATAGADSLQEALSSLQADWPCDICSSCGPATYMGENIQDHILSASHWQCLSGKGYAPNADTSDDSLAHGPWMQTFACGNFSITFNHVLATISDTSTS
jgi:hypothetical protein